MNKRLQRPKANKNFHAIGKVGMLQHNKDRLGSRSGPMRMDDLRKDKFGSRHNQDPNGLQSDETNAVRASLVAVREKNRRRHRRLGSR